MDEFRSSRRYGTRSGRRSVFQGDAVGEIDLTAFYVSYRQDGWGRAAHDPAMMVALLVYAYAVGERSARGVERRCREDVAFRVITANQVPDHATIARFRVRHQDALAGLFGEVLRLCAKAGAVSVGVIAVDGTRVKANAADRANVTYEQLAREILAEADAIDAAEDEQFGERRGDELPPELADPNTRRARLREAKRRLDADWEAKHQEMEDWRVAKAAYTARTGRTKIGAPPKPRPVAPAPEGRINITDPDSRPVKTARGFVQGYTAQVVATAEQIVSARHLTSSIRQDQPTPTTDARWGRFKPSRRGQRKPSRRPVLHERRATARGSSQTGELIRQQKTTSENRFAACAPAEL